MSTGVPSLWMSRFERVILISVQLILVFVIAVAAIELWVLLLTRLRASLSEVDSVFGLQEAVQRVFAGVLLVVLGLELLETLRTYASEHHVRLETILTVAVIAMGRHIIQIDVDHHDGAWLIGVGALFLSLTGGYFLVKRVR